MSTELLSLKDELLKAFPDKPEEKAAETEKKEAKEKEPEEDEETEEIGKAISKLSKKYGEDDNEDVDDDDMERFLINKNFPKAMAKKAVTSFKTGKLKKSLFDIANENEKPKEGDENNEVMIDVTDEFNSLQKSFNELRAENTALKQSIESINKSFDFYKENAKRQNKALAHLIENGERLQKSLEGTPIMKGTPVASIEKSFANPEQAASEFASMPEIKKGFAAIADKNESANKAYLDFLAGNHDVAYKYKSEIEQNIGKKMPA